MQFSHLLRFYSGDGSLTFLSRLTDGSVQEIKLCKQSSESITFGERTACIGYRTPDGYFPCPTKAANVRQCHACLSRDVSKVYTEGDFSAYPQLYEEAKKEEYCLYLAQFGQSITKCGVTRKERFEERMREQGADFGCIVAVFLGPDEVYQAEKMLQARFGFANAVWMVQKMQNLAFDKSAARENFSSLVETVRASGILPDFKPQVADFSGFYPQVRNPRQASDIAGRLLGAKGELLFFRSPVGEDFCVNMRRKAGSFYARS
ncbi:MAG: DUF2797 domain-containing protein [Candidatus Micrarchaeota archaeon]|nr:DUF2797 domain-containing protein [Candidatus Micrarchaeota archaeon]